MSAPIEPHRVRLVLCEVAQQKSVHYPFEAHVMGRVMRRLVDFLDEDWKEQAGGLRDLLNRCGEDETFVIEG